MDKNAAATLIKDTLQQPFDKARYTAFVKNLLNTIDEEKAFSYFGQYVPEKFRDFVKGYERIGTYTDPSDQKIDVLIVYLKNDATLARARTSQRNFISNYLKTRDAKDAGLIAFVAPNPEEWRFSFVKMEYKLVEKKGKVRAEEEFTPARRYSFLVGQHESSHTAQHQLLPILADDKHNPTLEIIENAFNIETVTKEFFEKYRELFLQVKEALDALTEGNAALKKEFETKNVNTADFAKKLLGQIVFLYFLQKKGWFGVERDSVWGSGPKNFLRQLFEGKLMKYGNFFNDVLEPLFYEALAVERESNFYSKFNCKIPFLNGGLFDPLNSYDWVHTDITLPNELFSNDVRTKEGDIGTGILDMFDRYNFTVKEDEPLEKEVAVDPEMLGKVFENLLEVSDRKSKGTYYTPREIVHYMCQESIINYLATELEGVVSKEHIVLLIQMGETVIEHESRVVKKGEETDTYSFKLPESVRKNAALIDQKLATIRVCDPAIGSGAFPVGMMNEIVRARQTLTSYLPANDDRLPYDFKRHAIQESLYGVDIDPGAVEIAKLRLWLSLIVDEDDIERIKPLPNLDYRIMQGNSLLEEFDGIRLFDERLLESTAEEKGKQLEEIKTKMGALQQEYFALHSDGKLTDARKEEIESEIKRQKAYQKQLQTQPQVSENMGIFDTPSKVTDMLGELKGLHRAFFEATQRKKKEELKNKIEKLEWELVETSLTERNKGELLSKLQSKHTRPFFLWKLYFFEVFQQKGGFDVVIANPPYVRHEDIKELKPQLKNAYAVHSGKADLYCYFFELGNKLLHNNGVLSFITSNKYLRADYGKPLKNYLKSHTSIQRIIDFGDLPVFDASAYPCILIAEKGNKPNQVIIGMIIEGMEQLQSLRNAIEINGIPLEQNTLADDVWNIEEPHITALQKKIEGNSQNTKCIDEYTDGIFYGIKTGLSEAFVIDRTTKDELILEDKNSKELLVPFLRGKDIKRYKIEFDEKYLIKLSNGWTDRVREKVEPEKFLREKYPAIYKHLKQFEDRLKKRDDQGRYWWELRPCDYEWAFEKPKIISARFMTKAMFAYDQKGYFTNDACYIIPTNDLYLCGVINSQLAWFYLQKKCCSVQNDYSQIHIQFLAKVPIRLASDEQKEKIAILVQDILDRTGKGAITHIEDQIDKLVYGIYGLTEEEIETLENNII